VDVHYAFLHGALDEEIYMVPLLGLHKQREKSICHLHKSLYRLKQASHQWYAKFTNALMVAKFQLSKHNYTWFKWRQGTSSIYLLIYVDDILIMGNDASAIDEFKKKIALYLSYERFGTSKILPWNRDCMVK